MKTTLKFDIIKWLVFLPLVIGLCWTERVSWWIPTLIVLYSADILLTHINRLKADLEKSEVNRVELLDENHRLKSKLALESNRHGETLKKLEEAGSFINGKYDLAAYVKLHQKWEICIVEKEAKIAELACAYTVIENLQKDLADARTEIEGLQKKSIIILEESVLQITDLTRQLAEKWSDHPCDFTDYGKVIKELQAALHAEQERFKQEREFSVWLQTQCDEAQADCEKAEAALATLRERLKPVEEVYEKYNPLLQDHREYTFTTTSDIWQAVKKAGFKKQI